MHEDDLDLIEEMIDDRLDEALKLITASIAALDVRLKRLETQNGSPENGEYH